MQNETENLKQKNLELLQINKNAKNEIKALQEENTHDKSNFLITEELIEYILELNERKRIYFIIKRFIREERHYKIKNANKLSITTTKENKELIKKYMKQRIPNTNLTDLFNNLDNGIVPQILMDKEKNKKLIEKYKGKCSLIKINKKPSKLKPTKT